LSELSYYLDLINSDALIVVVNTVPTFPYIHVYLKTQK
jgi:hypothetical protein